MGRFLTYTRNCEQKANLAVVKSALKIPSRHNGVIPIKIKGYVIKGHMAYFISDQDSKKGIDPNICVIDGMHNIKGKDMLMFLSVDFSYCWINLVEAWYSLEQYIGLKEDKLSSTTVDFIRSEGNLETKHLYLLNQYKHLVSRFPSDLMKSTVVDESLSSFKPMYCSREYQASTRLMFLFLTTPTNTSPSTKGNM